MPICTICSTEFETSQRAKKMHTHFDVNEPTDCSDCRLRLRLNFRNERSLYKRTSSLSEKSIISIYSPESPFKVFSQEEWWSDNWDGQTYGRDFDFTRPFFEQFKELLLEVPRIALFNINPENSAYCQQAYNNRNCYMCTVVTECEDSMYVTHSNKVNDSFDSTFIQGCELCYECLDSEKLYRCVETQSSQNSNGLIFCKDCIGCQDCIGCYGLRNKKYHILNKPFTEEQYKKNLEELDLGRNSHYLKYKAYFKNHAKTLPQRSTQNLKTIDCTGDYLINAQNCANCFDCYEIQDCSDCVWIFNSHNCVDVYGLGGGSYCYNSLGIENTNNCTACTFVSDSADVFYSDTCFYSSNLFGCAGLKNKKHCILNKQYSEEEYKVMIGKIIAHMKQTGEWGQFFPANLSPFAYNETAAQARLPLTKAEAIQKGFTWKEPDAKEYKPATITIPDSIKDVENSITDHILACTDCGKNYKTTLQELNYCRANSLPLSRFCSDCRYSERLKLRNPKHLWTRSCISCNSQMLSSIDPQRPEKVYCEKCYLDTVN